MLENGEYIFTTMDRWNGFGRKFCNPEINLLS